MATLCYPVEDKLIGHLSPLAWEDINLTGDYVWRQSKRVEKGKFRPLRHSPVNGPLTSYKEYLLSHWEAGCQNALQLWRELRAKGYTGSATTVRNFVLPLRQPGMTPAIKRAERSIPSPRALSWWLVLPERRTAEQVQIAERLCAACPSLAESRALATSFQEMMHRRAVSELDGWLERAKASGLACFATFVWEILADKAAVEEAFTYEWSNGPAEGHVNRLKFIKRQGELRPVEAPGFAPGFSTISLKTK